MRSKASGSVGGGRRLAAEANQRRASVRRTGLPARRQSWARIAQEGRRLTLEPFRTLLRGEAAEDLAEYGIALAVVAVAAITAALLINADVTALWQNAQLAIHSAV